MEPALTFNTGLPINFWVLLLIIAWTLPWKGYALWIAAKKSDKWWFIILLVINTLAVLEILYIFVFSKRKSSKSHDIEAIKDAEGS